MPSPTLPNRKQMPLRKTARTKLKSEVLKWVNEQRENLGLKPLSKLPKGRPYSSESCPVSNSFKEYDKHSAGYLSISFFNHDEQFHSLEVPRNVTEWMRRFDKGEYPSLETKPGAGVLAGPDKLDSDPA